MEKEKFLNYLSYFILLVGISLILLSIYVEWNKLLLRYYGIVALTAGAVSVVWRALKNSTIVKVLK
ncbi:hypothetical protein ADU37_CDS19340 [Thermococcus sp. 2319x1]|uniref:hypothetical protein n=1 Tax=Thermococcus sp. 2319x1 TaxID=1674923 RepID=UPI00073AB823|nr:hypothetical protein [Thermococcus sp. 2319x1]ALV63633.1 hypothetical protein ADU37_CDS19340 [Thermococcus sp. 2319x1]